MADIEIKIREDLESRRRFLRGYAAMDQRFFFSPKKSPIQVLVAGVLQDVKDSERSFVEVLLGEAGVQILNPSPPKKPAPPIACTVPVGLPDVNDVCTLTPKQKELLRRYLNGVERFQKFLVSNKEAFDKLNDEVSLQVWGSHKRPDGTQSTWGSPYHSTRIATPEETHAANFLESMQSLLQDFLDEYEFLYQNYSKGPTASPYPDE